MTLSRWLRDYVYIPLGGNRKGDACARTEPAADDADRRALARRRLDVRRLGRAARRRTSPPGGCGAAAPRYAADAGFALWRRRIVTFHLVCLAWVFFRADSFGTAKDVLTGLFTRWGQASPLVTFGVVVAIVAGIASQYLPARWPRALMERFSRLPVVAQAAVLGVGLMVTSVMGPRAWHPSSTSASDDGRDTPHATRPPADAAARHRGRPPRR